MKSIKMLVLVALAGLLAMAIAGPSSAAAESTALCLEDPGEGEPCQEGSPLSQLIAHVHEATSEGKKATLLSSIEVQCDVLFLGDVTSENYLGTPLAITGNFTYTNCEGCEVEEVSKSSTIKVLRTAHELAEVTGEGEVHVLCPGLIDCTYKGEKLVAHALGPLLTEAANGETRIEEQAVTKVPGGFLCPKTSKLDILTTPLSATYISEGPAAESTALCLEDPGEGEPCQEGSPTSQLIAHVHEATAEGKKAVLLSVVEVECDVLFLGDVTSENNLGSPLAISGNFTYTNCGSCEVKEVSKSSTIKVLRTAHELAEVTGEGEVHVLCFGFIDCTYKGEKLVAHALGPLLTEAANGETRIEEQAVTKVPGGFLCPKTSKLDILTTPLSATYISE